MYNGVYMAYIGLDLIDGRAQLARLGVARLPPAAGALALADEEGGGEAVPGTERVVAALGSGRGRRGAATGAPRSGSGGQRG